MKERKEKKAHFSPLLTQMVLLLVLQSGKPGLEVLVTEGALEGAVLAVQDHVLFQVRPAREGLLTHLGGAQSKTRASLVWTTERSSHHTERLFGLIPGGWVILSLDWSGYWSTG